MLEARGLTPAWREALRGRLALAESLTQLSPGGVTEDDAEQLRARLVGAREWYEEWAAIARSELTRKDYLILLGLAQRKGKKGTKEPRVPEAPKATPGKGTEAEPLGA